MEPTFQAISTEVLAGLFTAGIPTPLKIARTGQIVVLTCGTKTTALSQDVGLTIEVFVIAFTPLKTALGSTAVARSGPVFGLS